MRNERGITLIALVVTIVVLLILAGITITYTLSNNGIFTKAQSTEQANTLGNLRDYMAMAKLDAITEYYSNTAKDWTQTAGQTELVGLVQNSFPGFTVAASGTLTLDENGLGGSVTATANSVAYTVNFTNNTVTAPAE